MNISVGKKIWVLQSGGALSRWDSKKKQWEIFGGSYRYIFADPRSENGCYFVDGNGLVGWRDVATSQTRSYPGITAKSVTVGGNGRIWAIQSNGIWARWAPVPYSRWDRYSESRMFIFADPTTEQACYFINPDGSVHWRNVDRNQNKTFRGIKAKEIAVGGGRRLWAIQSNGVWTRWAPEPYTRWDIYSEQRQHIFADPTTEQACYFINPDGSVHWRNVDRNQNKTFPGINVNPGSKPTPQAPSFVFGGKRNEATRINSAPDGKYFTGGTANIYVRGDLSFSSEYIQTSINGKKLGNLSSGKDSSQWYLWKKDFDLTPFVFGTQSFEVKGVPTAEVNFSPGGMSNFWELGFNFNLKTANTVALSKSGSISARISLTEDHDESMQKQQVFRAVISFPPMVLKAELRAEKEVEVMIDGQSYRLNPAVPTKVPTNALGKMVLTLKSIKLGVPAIYVRTESMRADERYVICLDTPGYQKIEEMKRNTIANNRQALNIKDKYSDEACQHVEEAIRHLAQTYQSTYNYVEGADGISRDRYIRPHNMDNLHWSYSKDNGFQTLSPEQIDAATGNPRLMKFVTQWFGEDLFDAAKKVVKIVVHTVAHTAETAYKLADNAINTVEHIASDTTDTLINVAKDRIEEVKNVGDDLVHGNFSKIPGDIWEGETSVVKDVFTGGENVVGDVVSGAKNALVITLKSVDEEIQFVLNHTGQVGAAIKTILHQIEVEIEHFLKWVADKLGWEDILAVQDHLEQTIVDGMDQVTQIITEQRTQFVQNFNLFKSNFHSNSSKVRELVKNEPRIGKNGGNNGSSLDKPKAELDTLMSKMSRKDSSNFQELQEIWQKSVDDQKKHINRKPIILNAKPIQPLQVCI